MNNSDYQSAKRDKEAITALLESRGWELVSKALQTQIENRGMDVSQPLAVSPNPINALFIREALAGERVGLQTALEMPDTITSACDCDIEAYERSLSVKENILTEDDDYAY